MHAPYNNKNLYMKPAHVDYFTNLSSSSSYNNRLNFMRWLLKMVWWCQNHSDLTVDLITKPFNATDNFSLNSINIHIAVIMKSSSYCKCAMLFIRMKMNYDESNLQLFIHSKNNNKKNVESERSCH